MGGNGDDDTPVSHPHSRQSGFSPKSCSGLEPMSGLTVTLDGQRIIAVDLSSLGGSAVEVASTSSALPRYTGGYRKQGLAQIIDNTD